MPSRLQRRHRRRRRELSVGDGQSYPTSIVRYGFVQTDTDFYVFGGVSDGSEVTTLIATTRHRNVDVALPMPFTSEAPTCSRRMAALFTAHRATPATASHRITSPPTPGRRWLPIRLLRITTALHRAFNGKVFVVGP
jgi:hypothetical protein